ncbi:Cof subfamily of IIB subfamily of haloacid dehalogenase superfamily/HAD-superfamily hydrolase, subfamily IIB [Paenibacillus sp. 1_12]|uniref:Cof-type HAD-IIB family hydrolase n=1 Tax=Paenibacillus sp. 1_12 TaxID=1566278 RepID=UPI0008E3E21E|nr:Cof-type HAD-IIB family hydrolase [Paenibacillus sp. 1_12]SFK74296.1 Cof subfamily of IIB subfamily of haloacid dehalogenase superfamily/HAD-superfamily hydrolase, subfamily IIB [Paenibacillus sp. 1_12]
MSVIEAVVLDLDGTLLNSRREVSPRSLRAILACHQAGIQVIIATARPARSVRLLLPPEMMELGCVIYYNGAHTVDATYETEDHLWIDQQTISDLYEAIIRWNSGTFVSFEVLGTMFSNRGLTQEQAQLLGFPDGDPMPDVCSREDMNQFLLSKMLLSNEDDIYTELSRDFGQRVKIMLTDGGRLIQIMNAGVSKAAALLPVLNRRGIHHDQVMVFGDDYNDLELFDMCGYPVAMGNAIEELKSRAKQLTATNDLDGVAIVLESLLLNNKNRN